MLIDGDLTFVGRGIHGDGLYFSNSLSGSKAYGDHTGQTVGAVLNSKARVISETQLRQDYDAFVKSHPQARKALDINEKLRSLTPEQANKLAGHLNSCYPDKKKPAPAKKKPAAKGGKKK